MLCEIPWEDEYWEYMRERSENRKPDTDWEPDPERDWLFLDEVIEDLETEYKCQMTELSECDLLDIVEKMTGTVPLKAIYDQRMYGIEYEYTATEMR